MQRLAYQFAIVFTLIFSASSLPAAEDGVRYFGYYDPTYDSITNADKSESDVGAVVSSFKVKAVAATSAEYTDNAKLTKYNRKSDIANVTTAGLAAASDWDRHALNIGVVGNIKRFAHETSENKEGVRLFANGRVDINDVWNVDADVSYAKDSEGRNDPQETSPTLSRLRGFENSGGGLGLNYNAGILKFSTRAGYNHITYDRLDGETLGFRDRDIYRYSTRIAYPLSDVVDIYVQPAYTQEMYDEKADASGLNRDNEAYQLYGGFIYQVTDLTTLDVAAGQVKRQFNDARLKDAKGFGFDISLNWRPLDELSVNASLNRSIESTSLSGVNNLVVTGGRIAPSYAITEVLFANAELGYEQYRFSGTPLTDKDYLAGGGLNYLWDDGIKTSLNYSRRERASDVLIRDFIDNRFLVTLACSL